MNEEQKKGEMYGTRTDFLADLAGCPAGDRAGYSWIDDNLVCRRRRSRFCGIYSWGGACGADRGFSGGVHVAAIHFRILFQHAGTT